MLNSRTAALLVAAVALVFCAVGVQAQTVQFDFSTVYAGDTPTGAPPWATLVLETQGGGIVKGTLTNKMPSSSNQYITHLWLNTASNPAGIVLLPPVDPQLATFQVGEDAFEANSSWFDVRIGFKKLPSQDRVMPGDTAVFYVKRTGLTANEFKAAAVGGGGVYSMIHIVGTPGSYGFSRATLVPEPGSLGLLALGAVPLLVRFRRRRAA